MFGSLTARLGINYLSLGVPVLVDATVDSDHDTSEDQECKHSILGSLFRLEFLLAQLMTYLLT